MDTIPITLCGNNLGERHQYLNNLVNVTYEKRVDFEGVRYLKEHSPVDRLFKIDLANKYRHFQYIIQVLQDDDMLYVSRALKCLWLIKDLQYSNIINPNWLETELYPNMMTVASNKMRHVISLNLQDTSRCEEFYSYYKKKEKSEYALKFLPKCSEVFIIQETRSIPIGKINPQLLKLLCEKSSQVALIYFKDTVKNGTVNEEYIRKMIHLLKTDAEVYFFIIENYFQAHFKRLSKETTKYIMENHRPRYEAKSELYVARILHIATVSTYLNSEDTKNLTIRLAQAEYLNIFPFCYKFVEPLMKKIDDPKERIEFCKQVFEDKVFNKIVTVPPYRIPSMTKNNTVPIDQDKDYDILLNGPIKIPRFRGGGGGGGDFPPTFDQLFDQYRFSNFNKTFIDLQKRIFQQSNMITRRNMFMVLISKCGENEDNVYALMNFFNDRFSNEPPNVKGAIIRSLVNRAAAWRFSAVSWNLFIEFARDLTCDDDVYCKEYWHCIVLRDILRRDKISGNAWQFFIKNSTTFTEYKISHHEYCKLREYLPVVILTAAKNSKIISTKLELLKILCNIVDEYQLQMESMPFALQEIFKLVSQNPKETEPLLVSLFKSRIACSFFFKEYFLINQTDASYCNILRHEADILESGQEFENLCKKNMPVKLENFLRKIAIYFGEAGGLSEKYSAVVQRIATVHPRKELARPLALLAGANHRRWPIIPVPSDHTLLLAHRELLNALWANVHLTRPKLAVEVAIRNVTLSALAVWLHTCSPVKLRNNFSTLLSNKRYARLVLAIRGLSEPGLLLKALPQAATARPVRALRTAIRIMRKNPHEVGQTEWSIIELLIARVDLSNKRNDIYCELAKINSIPYFKRLQYSVSLYLALNKTMYGSEKGPSHRIALPLLTCIYDNFQQVKAHIVLAILQKFLEKDFTRQVISDMSVDPEYWRCRRYNITFPGQSQRHLNGDYYAYVLIHLKIMLFYLFTSDSKLTQILRVQSMLKPFLEKIRKMWIYSPTKDIFRDFLNLLKCDKLYLAEYESGEVIMENIHALCNCVSDELDHIGLTINAIEIYRVVIKFCKESYSTLKAKYNKERDEIIALIFGRTFANEIENVVSEYFTSVRIVYVDYLKYHLNTFFDNSQFKYVMIFIAGLVEDDTKINATVVGIMLFNYFVRFCPKDFYLQEIWEKLKNVQGIEARFFLYNNEKSSHFVYT